MKKARWDSSGLFRAAPQTEDFSFQTSGFFAALLCVTQEKSAQSGAKKLCLGALVFCVVLPNSCAFCLASGLAFRAGTVCAAFIGRDARISPRGEERVDGEVDLAEQLAGALRGVHGAGRAGLRGDAVVECRDEKLCAALHPRDGKLPDRDLQALCLTLQNELVVKAGEDRLGDLRRFRRAATAAYVAKPRAEDDRIDDLHGDGRHAAVFDLTAALAAAVTTVVRFGAALAAKEDQPLCEHGKPRDGDRAGRSRSRLHPARGSSR